MEKNPAENDLLGWKTDKQIIIDIKDGNNCF